MQLGGSTHVFVVKSQSRLAHSSDVAHVAPAGWYASQRSELLQKLSSKHDEPDDVHASPVEGSLLHVLVEKSQR